MQPDERRIMLIECSCTDDAPWCELLAGRSSWFLDVFGHGYAKDFFTFFEDGDLEKGPFFKRLDKHTEQTRPLQLRDVLV